MKKYSILKPEIKEKLEQATDHTISAISDDTNKTSVANMRKLIHNDSQSLCLPHFQQAIIKHLGLSKKTIIYKIIDY